MNTHVGEVNGFLEYPYVSISVIYESAKKKLNTKNKFTNAKNKKVFHITGVHQEAALYCKALNNAPEAGIARESREGGEEGRGELPVD